MSKDESVGSESHTLLCYVPTEFVRCQNVGKSLGGIAAELQDNAQMLSLLKLYFKEC